MTLFPSIPGLEAVVVVGGVDAQEYDVPDNDENPIESLNLADYDAAHTSQGNIPHVVRYIEAKPGADFVYRVTIKPNFIWRSHHVAVEAQNDAVKGGLAHLHKHDTDRNGSIMRRLRGMACVELDNLRPSDMQLQIKAAKQCGCLKLSLYRMQRGEIANSAGRSFPDISTSQATQFSEKAFKGKAVDCVSTFITEPNPRGPPKTYTGNYTDNRKRPFAVFEFRYRSKEGLMIEGIIPRPPQETDFEILRETKPVKREGVISIDDAGTNGSQTVPGQSALEQVNGMSDDEVRRRLAELLDQKNPGNRPMKRENPMDDAEFSARYKTRKLNNGHVEIDLTDD